MVRRFAVFLGALMSVALLFSATALAAETTTYELDALDMSIDIPDDYVVFTRDMSADDPTYAQFGLSKEEMGEILEESKAYLDAVMPDVSHEIVVTMEDNSPLEDFGQLSDTSLSAIASMLQDAAEDYGITYVRSEIYQHEQVKFIRLYSSHPNNDQTVYTLQYYTVCNGQAINISMHSYVGKITQANEDELQKTVDSADFRNAKTMKATGLETEPFLYTDMEAGLSFTVPANWTQVDFLAEREILDAKFESTKEEGLCILYGSVDLWEELPESERVGYVRAELDNSVVSAIDISDLAKEWGIEDEKVSTIDFKSKTHFVVEGTCNSQVYGLNVSAPVTVLMRIENGYLFQFWFMAWSDSPYYDDFIRLVRSVKYPRVTAEEFDIHDAPTFTEQPTSSGGLDAGDVLVGLVVIIVGGVGAFVILRSNAAEKQPASVELDSRCPYCEAPVPNGVRFCHRCGNRLQVDAQQGGDEA